MPYRTDLKRPDLKGNFPCSVCGKVFCHSSSLSRHRMQAHFKSYTCAKCNMEISSNDTLRTHMYKVHQVSRMFMCRCCNWAFADKIVLHAHMASMGSTGDPGDVEVLARTSVESEYSQEFRAPKRKLPTQLNSKASMSPNTLGLDEADEGENLAGDGSRTSASPPMRMADELRKLAAPTQAKQFSQADIHQALQMIMNGNANKLLNTQQQSNSNNSNIFPSGMLQQIQQNIQPMTTHQQLQQHLQQQLDDSKETESLKKAKNSRKSAPGAASSAGASSALTPKDFLSALNFTSCASSTATLNSAALNSSASPSAASSSSVTSVLQNIFASGGAAMDQPQTSQFNQQQQSQWLRNFIKNNPFGTNDNNNASLTNSSKILLNALAAAGLGIASNNNSGGAIISNGEGTSGSSSDACGVLPYAPTSPPMSNIGRLLNMATSAQPPTKRARLSNSAQSQRTAQIQAQLVFKAYQHQQQQQQRQQQQQQQQRQQQTQLNGNYQQQQKGFFLEPAIDLPNEDSFGIFGDLSVSTAGSSTLIGGAPSSSLSHVSAGAESNNSFGPTTSSSGSPSPRANTPNNGNLLNSVIEKIASKQRSEESANHRPSTFSMTSLEDGRAVTPALSRSGRRKGIPQHVRVGSSSLTNDATVTTTIDDSNTTKNESEFLKTRVAELEAVVLSKSAETTVLKTRLAAVANAAASARQAVSTAQETAEFSTIQHYLKMIEEFSNSDLNVPIDTEEKNVTPAVVKNEAGKQLTASVVAGGLDAEEDDDEDQDDRIDESNLEDLDDTIEIRCGPGSTPSPKAEAADEEEEERTPSPRPDISN